MNKSKQLSRRAFCAGATAALATTTAFPALAAGSPEERRSELEAYLEMYGPMPNEPFPIPAVDLSKVDPVYLRKYGEYETSERPGTVIVDTAKRVLFLTLPEGKGIRYGVGIGRDGFSWSGRAVIRSRKPGQHGHPPQR